MEFLSLSRRRSSARNVPIGEERGETDAFAGYVLTVKIRQKWAIIVVFRCSKILGEEGTARNFTTNLPKILDLKSSFGQIFSENCRWVPL